ncbi:MAG TPA: TetR family transcriptional regulator [Bacteroidia bacterium]
MASKKNLEVNISTEEKIREAARKVFTTKGYAATRTRDIADEAGINLALLNYYFRSKDKLFEVVMLEKIKVLFGTVVPVINNSELSIEDKIKGIVDIYIDMLLENPDLPIFVLSELRGKSDRFLQEMRIDLVLRESHLVQQIKKRFPDRNPVQYIMSILGMTIFPFLMKPIFINVGVVNETQYKMLMLERKRLIPQWIKAILKE